MIHVNQEKIIALNMDVCFIFLTLLTLLHLTVIFSDHENSYKQLIYSDIEYFFALKSEGS